MDMGEELSPRKQNMFSDFEYMITDKEIERTNGYNGLEKS